MEPPPTFSERWVNADQNGFIQNHILKKTLLLEVPFSVVEILFAVEVKAIIFPSPETDGS